MALFAGALVASLARSGRRPAAAPGPTAPVGGRGGAAPTSWSTLLGPSGSRPDPARLAIASVGWGLLAAAAGRPLIGAVARMAVAVGYGSTAVDWRYRWPRFGSLVAVSVYAVLEQHRYRYLPTID